MKKEETYKKNIAIKNECNIRSRSLSPKAYLGCDTCRTKKVKSNNKINEWKNAQEKSKGKKSFPKKDEEGLQNHKIKLTDLCDEDKGKIIELIDELSKLEEKNQQLKVKLNEVQKEKQNQQDHMLKQAKLFLEEKNFFVSEISKYKGRQEKFESEMSDRLSNWEKCARLKDSKIIYFAKALRKSVKEKNELHQLMTRLKTCLKNSLESFQKLRGQVTELQNQDQERKICKSICCQTESSTNAFKKDCSLPDDGNEEEFFSACNQGEVNSKNSLDIINNKLEYVYRCLKKNKEKFPDSPPQKYDIDLSILLKNENLAKDEKNEGLTQRNEDEGRILKGENNENEEEFLKPEKKCSKTLLEVENILKSIGHPLNAMVNECTQVLECNNLNVSNFKEPPKSFLRCSNFLQNKIVQKNNIFKSSEDDLNEEDRLLEELFYSDQSLNLGLEAILKLETKYCNDRPFTW